jgi:hypothetical protein
MQSIWGVRRLIVSAFAVLVGQRGEVSREAARRGEPRQSIYRESRRLVAALEGNGLMVQVEQLRQELAEKSARIAELEKALAEAVPIPADKQAEFASMGQAEGVSLPVLRRLLMVFLGEQTPSVPTLGRHSAEAAQRAGELLEVLDGAARPRVKELAADEIFLDTARS